MKKITAIFILAHLFGCGTGSNIKEDNLPRASSRNDRIEDIKEWKNIKDWKTVSVVFCGIQTEEERYDGYSGNKIEFNKDIDDIGYLSSKNGIRDEKYSVIKFDYSDKLQAMRILGFKVKNPFFFDDEWTFFPKVNVHHSEAHYEWSEDAGFDFKNHYVIRRDTLKLTKLMNFNSSLYPTRNEGFFEEKSEWDCRKIEEVEFNEAIAEFKERLLRTSERWRKERIEKREKQLDKNKI